MIVTLLTDFGDMDGFVGAMRGRVLSRAPHASLADLAHHVPRGDVAKASRVLRRAAPCFPSGTVHLVVVDPGVGSSRRAVVARCAGHLFVAPDNGVLSGALDALGGPIEAWAITAPALMAAQISVTFHGRDVFAPVAGALAAGHPPHLVGPAIDDLVRASRSAPVESEGWIVGRVIEVDQYGNLITDVPPPGGEVEVQIAEGAPLVGPASSYSEVAVGDAVVVVGSEGTLEVAVREGSAAARLGAGVSERVRVRRRS